MTARDADDARRGIELPTRASSRSVQSELANFGFPLPLACRVVGCEACADDSTFTEVTEMQLDKMRLLLAGVGKQLSTDGGGPVCVCHQHRSTAIELIGALVAELPPSDRRSEFRVGRILDIEARSTSTRSQPPVLDGPALEGQDAEAAPPAEATFSERFADDTVRYRVGWYDDDGARWLEDDELPPLGFTTYDIEQVRRGLDVFVGLCAYYERCASAKAWRIMDIGELGRKAKKNTAIFGYRVIKFFASNTTLAKISILCFRLLVLAVAGVFLWAIWISYAKADKHLAAALSAGAISVLSTTIAMFEIISHLQNVHSPELQTYVVRILFIVPVFAIDCWLSLRFAQTEPKWIVYVNTTRDVYEAFVIHTFFLFLTACFGENGSAHLCRVLAEKPQQEHLFGLRHVLRAPKMGEPFLLFCQYGTLQFVTVKTVCSITEAALHNADLFEPVRPFSPHQPFLYLTLAINGSQMVALYALAMFYHACHTDLAPIRPLGKFLSVKLIVFFTFWQSIAISLAVRTGLLHGTQRWGVRHISAALNNYLLCIEMFFAALLHQYVFSHRDFKAKLVHESRQLRRFDSMVLRVVDPRKVVFDTWEMLFGCLRCRCFCTSKSASPKPSARSAAATDKATLLGRPEQLPLTSSQRGPPIAFAAHRSALDARGRSNTIAHLGSQQRRDDITASMQRGNAAAPPEEAAFSDPQTGQPFQDARSDGADEASERAAAAKKADARPAPFVGGANIGLSKSLPAGGYTSAHLV